MGETEGGGAPLQAAVIGVRDMAASLAVYRDALGLDVVERRQWRGSAFEALWRLPPGAAAETVVLADRGFEYGRVMLLDFGGDDRIEVRDIADGLAVVGLVNLNFYARDIVAATDALAMAGCRPWSAPLSHDMGPQVGSPIEVMIDGPDTVVLNLLQHTPGPDTRSGRMGLYMRDAFGYSRAGLTPVVTSAHNVRDMDLAVAFYREVLGLEPVLDVVMAGEDMTTFMALPAGSQARAVIVQGRDRFGKIALTQALTYDCADLAPRAVAPNIGYLGQAFVVADLSASLSTARSQGARPYSGPLETDLPGLGSVRTAIVCHPASGALQQLIQPSS